MQPSASKAYRTRRENFRRMPNSRRHGSTSERRPREVATNRLPVSVEIRYSDGSRAVATGDAADVFVSFVQRWMRRELLEDLMCDEVPVGGALWHLFRFYDQSGREAKPCQTVDAHDGGT